MNKDKEEIQNRAKRARRSQLQKLFGEREFDVNVSRIFMNEFRNWCN